jgi:hypothetical protein
MADVQALDMDIATETSGHSVGPCDRAKLIARVPGIFRGPRCVRLRHVDGANPSASRVELVAGVTGADQDPAGTDLGIRRAMATAKLLERGEDRTAGIVGESLSLLAAPRFYQMVEHVVLARGHAPAGVLDPTQAPGALVAIAPFDQRSGNAPLVGVHRALRDELVDRVVLARRYVGTFSAGAPSSARTSFG